MNFFPFAVHQVWFLAILHYTAPPTPVFFYCLPVVRSQLRTEMLLSAEMSPWESCSLSIPFLFLSSWFFRNALWICKLKNHSVKKESNMRFAWKMAVWWKESTPHHRVQWEVVAAAGVCMKPLLLYGLVGFPSPSLGSLSESGAWPVTGVLLHRCHPWFVLSEELPFCSSYSFLCCATTERAEPQTVLRIWPCHCFCEAMPVTKYLISCFRLALLVLPGVTAPGMHPSGFVTV